MKVFVRNSGIATKASRIELLWDERAFVRDTPHVCVCLLPFFLGIVFIFYSYTRTHGMIASIYFRVRYVLLYCSSLARSVEVAFFTTTRVQPQYLPSRVAGDAGNACVCIPATYVRTMSAFPLDQAPNKHTSTSCT